MGLPLGGRVLRGRWPIVVTGLAVSFLVASCGGDEEPELTFEDKLVALEGRSLTPAEVADRVATGETLCQLDDQILDEMWQLLTDDQLDFQDLIIAELCPERAILYAGHTGRFVTDEAEESGVRTSTTRPEPTSSTAATGPTTTWQGTTATGGTGTSSGQPDPSATSTTGSATSSPGSSSTSASVATPSSPSTTTSNRSTTTAARPTTASTAPTTSASTSSSR